MVGFYPKQQVAAALSFMKLIPTEAGELCSLKARQGWLWLGPEKRASNDQPIAVRKPTSRD